MVEPIKWHDLSAVQLKAKAKVPKMATTIAYQPLGMELEWREKAQTCEYNKVITTSILRQRGKLSVGRRREMKDVTISRNLKLKTKH